MIIGSGIVYARPEAASTVFDGERLTRALIDTVGKALALFVPRFRQHFEESL